jgi:hypothetical protein
MSVDLPNRCAAECSNYFRSAYLVPANNYLPPSETALVEALNVSPAWKVSSSSAMNTVARLAETWTSATIVLQEFVVDPNPFYS